MVLISTLSSKFNKLIATPLLRYGLSARYRFGGGIIRDNQYLDAALFLPLAQALISIEVAQEEQESLKDKSKAKQSRLDEWLEELWEKWKLDRFSLPQDETDERPIRLKSLEYYLRPALVPNECWSDIARWRFHTRFVQWARKEYLIAQYGQSVKEALECYPKLRQNAMLKRKTTKNLKSYLLKNVGKDAAVNNPVSSKQLILPSLDLLEKALYIQYSNTTTKMKKNHLAELKPMSEIVSRLGGDLLSIHSSLSVAANIKGEASTSQLSLQDILEVAGGQVNNRGPFQVLCEEANVYEFWTRDYVQNLATYLRNQCNQHNNGKNSLILEVGAGDGLLTHFLREYMSSSSSYYETKGFNKTKRQQKTATDKNKAIPTIVATDNGSWNIPSIVPGIVEPYSVEQTLQRYCDDSSDEKKHVIVICSWMPNGVDWTQLMRDAQVDEYILIGECDDGSCGDNWLTWGNSEFHPHHDDDDNSNHGTTIDTTPRYELDGYKRHDLHNLSKLQLARFDSNVSRTSHTVSFRKN